MSRTSIPTGSDAWVARIGDPISEVPADDPYQADYYSTGDGYTTVSLLTRNIVNTCGPDGFG